nr:E3 ubiquitin-protein ligase HERC2-like isoform X2 [Pongo abelii]
MVKDGEIVYTGTESTQNGELPPRKDDSVESSGTKKEDLDDKEKKDETPAPVYRAKSILESWGCSWNTRHERARSIPLQDQHLALAILLELAVQRGTLSQMLSAILLLLQLWDSGAQETDNERSAQGTSAPLLPLLQRFQSIICRKDMPHSNGDMYLLSGPLSPSESFLRYLTLPQDNELAIDLQQMAVFVTALLDRLATPCRCLCRIALQHLIRVIFYRSEL